MRVYRFDFPRFGAFNKKETFTTSGTFTAPVSGVYRITLQGGGGGGGSAGTDGHTEHSGGGGGGQGGNGVFYETLIAGTTYTYTIGAGGPGGTGGSAAASTGENGSTGGTSSITIGANTYTAEGGIYGRGYRDVHRGGMGGAFKINGTTISRGASGSGGTLGARSTNGGVGGGPGGGDGGMLGGGGTGGLITYYSVYESGYAGGDGYITFEYCDVT